MVKAPLFKGGWGDLPGFETLTEQYWEKCCIWLIYYLQTADSIILLTVYSKSVQEDIGVVRVREIIEQVME